MNDRRGYVRNWSNCEREIKKKHLSGFNEIRTQDLCVFSFSTLANWAMKPQL